MSTYAFARPLAAGKSDELRRFMSEATGPRRAEHDELMRRYHLTKRYGWIQETPMGDMYVTYLEATDDFLEDNRRYAASTHPFDVWFKQQLGSILGMDFNQPFPPGFVEVLLESHEPWATGREQSVASAALVQPGKTEEVKRLTSEIKASKMEELREQHRRFSVSTENWYLQHTDQGDVLVYYTEGEDLMASYQAYAQSQHLFDQWQKQRLLDILGIDFNQAPPALPEMVLSAQMPRAAAA